MGTPFREVYETFLGKIEQDEWNLITDLGNLEQDWLMMLKSAINRFMFPRVSLKYFSKWSAHFTPPLLFIWLYWFFVVN